MNMARFGLVRAMMTRQAGSPKYGAVDKNYGGTEHDGFQDTFTVETEAMLEWGLIDRAGQYIDNYFGAFVRDDGSILYRGPETGQFGRMLTVTAQYFSSGGDAALLLKHRGRIDAVAHYLLRLRATALALPSRRCGVRHAVGLERGRFLPGEGSAALRATVLRQQRGGGARLGATWAAPGNRSGGPARRCSFK